MAISRKAEIIDEVQLRFNAFGDVAEWRVSESCETVAFTGDASQVTVTASDVTVTEPVTRVLISYKLDYVLARHSQW